MIVAIHQPNFLPWIGYFHKVSKVDKFVFFDDIQLPMGKSYCSRTKILINCKEFWLTVPILGKSDKLFIKDVEVNNINWKRKHLKTIELYYKKAKFFDGIFPIIEEIYKTNSNYLIDYNIPLIIKLTQYLDLNVEFIKSSDILIKSNKYGLDRIIEINRFLKADSYLSGLGKGSKRYIDEERFKREHINLIWHKFNHPVYQQLHCKHFLPNLSIIDFLFNCGSNSKNYL